MSQTAYRPDISILGPELAGVRMLRREFRGAEVAEGYRAELIDGVLGVSPFPSTRAQKLALAFYRVLHAHVSATGNRAFAEVLTVPRIFNPGPQETVPEPDLLRMRGRLTRSSIRTRGCSLRWSSRSSRRAEWTRTTAAIASCTSAFHRSLSIGSSIRAKRRCGPPSRFTDGRPVISGSSGSALRRGRVRACPLAGLAR